MRKISIFDIIIDILIVLLSLLVIYWGIKLILGGSPDLSEFNFGLVILIITFLYKMHREIGETKTETKHIVRGVKQGFNNIKYEMVKIREDINRANNNIELIKNKLKIK